MPTVSVIIPVYKVEKYLHRALDSLCANTFSDWEAICVNDGSPDGCASILESYSLADSRFKVLNKENGGLSDARNAGVRAATGDFVVFFDSDDFIHPQTLEIAVGIQKKTGTDIVSWEINPSYRDEVKAMQRRGDEALDYFPDDYFRRYDIDSIKYFVTDDIVSHSTEKKRFSGIRWPIRHFYAVRHLIRRSVVSRIPFIKGVTFEDFPWWCDLLLENPTCTITRLPLYYYYPNPTSIDNASAQVKKSINWLSNLIYCFRNFLGSADRGQMKKWSQQCKWPVIINQIGRNLSLFEKGTPEFERCSLLLCELDSIGALDDARTMRQLKYRFRIREFLKQ